MNKRNTHIRPLLAGRIRPYRRPPRPSEDRSSGPDLRISHLPKEITEESHVNQPHAEDCLEVLDELRRVDAALRLATDGIESIQRILQDLSTRLPQPEDSSESDIAAHTTYFDEVVHRIDRIVETTEFDGVRLLDGAWSVTLADAAGKGVRVLRIRPLAARDLGHSRIGGFLTSFASHTAVLPPASPSQADGPARRRAVLRCAILQVAALREQVAVFQREAVTPLIQTLEVTVENTQASHQAGIDSDFAHQVGNLTRLDALVQDLQGGLTSKLADKNVQDDFSSASSGKTFSGLTLSRDDSAISDPSDNTPHH
ncbi:MAG: hypothetical protein ACE5EQ_11375 [Phycisphaerae bacterium]